MTGSSLTQGEQVMAQKKSRTACPRKSLSWTVRVPSRIESAKLGGTSLTRGALGGAVREGYRVGATVGVRDIEGVADEHPPVPIINILVITSMRLPRLIMRER